MRIPSNGSPVPRTQMDRTDKIVLVFIAFLITSGITLMLFVANKKEQDQATVVKPQWEWVNASTFRQPVPGGWMYTYVGYSNSSSIFVPTGTASRE